MISSPSRRYLPEPGGMPLSDLPSSVSVYEVGPRDGLQHEPGMLDVGTKVAFISRLVASGLRDIEVASFSRPDLVPQLADAETVISELLSDPHSLIPPGATEPVRLHALVPNARGLDRALACGVGHVAVLTSASESFARANLGLGREEAMLTACALVGRANEAGAVVRGYVSMCFGDPWEGSVPIESAKEIVMELFGAGCSQVSIGDTIGVATPGHVAALLDQLREEGLSLGRLAVHFHDTYGQALSNSLVALQGGVATFDTSAGGLGGCPFAPGSGGNLATEDLLWMFDGLGVHTGVDISEMVAASKWIADKLGRPSPSGVVRALDSKQ